MEPDVIVGKSEAVKNAIENNQPLSTAMLNGVARNDYNILKFKSKSKL